MVTKLVVCARGLALEGAVRNGVRNGTSASRGRTAAVGGTPPERIDFFAPDGGAASHTQEVSRYLFTLECKFKHSTFAWLDTSFTRNGALHRQQQQLVRMHARLIDPAATPALSPALSRPPSLNLAMDAAASGVGDDAASTMHPLLEPAEPDSAGGDAGGSHALAATHGLAGANGRSGGGSSTVLGGGGGSHGGSHGGSNGSRSCSVSRPPSYIASRDNTCAAIPS